ncbi:MAG: hypothetical protein RLZZ408_1545, partial [Verrucomicrobiota bacterium]
MSASVTADSHAAHAHHGDDHGHG